MAHRINGQPGSYPLYHEDTPLDPEFMTRLVPLTRVRVPNQREWRKTATVLAEPLLEDAEIETPEGVMSAKAGDYLAQHPDGHAWPIKRETFESTYEEVE